MIQFLKLTIKLAKNLQINQTILPGYDNLSALDTTVQLLQLSEDFFKRENFRFHFDTTAGISHFHKSAQLLLCVCVPSLYTLCLCATSEIISN